MKKRPIKIKNQKHLTSTGQFLPAGFALQVYRTVLKIPLGQVRSYGWVAKKCRRPGAARAVGQILKRNPYPLIIPCHRVIKGDQSPGGYNLGRRQKKSLLSLEKELAQCLLSKK